MQDDGATPADDLEALLTKYTEAISESTRVKADTGIKIIAAIRELLAFSPGDERPGSAQSTVPDNRRLPSTFAELTQNPSGLSQLLSLSMLAAIVRWFSSESGRSEAEILEELAADLQGLRNFGQSVTQQITQDLHGK
jgi:hypothetical protein